jgi:hypothetical protein
VIVSLAQPTMMLNRKPHVLAISTGTTIIDPIIMQVFEITSATTNLRVASRIQPGAHDPNLASASAS